MAIARVVFACLLLFGCRAELAALHGFPMVVPADRQEVADHVLVRHDPHTGSTVVIGPIVYQGLMSSSYQIRSWINPGNPKIDNRFQIVVAATYPKRVYLKQAYADGAELDTVVIDRERIGCGAGCEIKETVGIAMSEAEMQKRAETGLSFRVMGRRASLVMAIPPAYFAALLDAHRTARGAVITSPKAVPRSGATPAGSQPRSRQASSPA